MMTTKDRIIEEAAHMFRTYGIRAVTMDMLASQMGMSKRTIYEVFRDKDEILGGVMTWMAAKQADLIKKSLATSDNVIEAIFKMMDSMMEHYRKMSPAFKLDMRRYHNEAVRRIGKDENFPHDDSRQILIQGIREGLFREDIDIDITDRCLRGVTKMSDEKEIPEGFENEEVIRDFFINYLRGISTQNGLDLINLYEKKRNGVASNRN